MLTLSLIPSSASIDCAGLTQPLILQRTGGRPPSGEVTNFGSLGAIIRPTSLGATPIQGVAGITRRGVTRHPFARIRDGELRQPLKNWPLLTGDFRPRRNHPGGGL